MKVLVCAASKHGATAQIGEAIADALNENGIHAALRAPQQIADLQGYDALVLGSGVYMGRWLPDARRNIIRRSAMTAHSTALRNARVLTASDLP